MGVSVGGFDLDDILSDLEDRNIECTAAKVIHSDQLVLFFVHTICQRGSGRLIDDPFDFQTGNTAGVFGGLSLGIIKISRYGNDRFGDGFTGKVFSRLFQFLEDKSGNLRRGILFPLDIDSRVILGSFCNIVGDHFNLFLNFGKPSPHKSLNGVYRIFRISDRLAFGYLSHQLFSVFGKSYNRGCGPATFRIGYILNFTFFHDGNR